MKNVFFLILVVSLFTACSSKNNTYTIRGSVSDSTYNGQTVYMSEYENNSVLDSAVVKDGKFTFTGSIDTAAIRRLDLNQKLYANIILENGEIVVDLNKANALSGTALNALMSEMNQKSTALMQDLRTTFEQIRNRTDISEEELNNLLNQTNDNMKAKYDSLMNSYFQNHQNDAFGCWVVWNWLDVLPAEKLDSIVAVSGDIIRNSKIVKQTQETQRQKAMTLPGKPFVDFKAQDENGNETSLSAYVGQGKYVLVDFWASWCGPCRGEIPYIAKAYKDYSKKGLVVLGVAVWDKLDAHQKAVKDLNITWTQLFEDKNEATKLYGIDGIPHIILFAPDGTIAARDLRGEGIEQELKKVLN